MKPLEQLKQEFHAEALPAFFSIDWELKANHSEKTPSGREWTSDFIATKGNMRLAIFFMDIQEEDEDLYSDENIRLREEQYSLVSESKVRGLWLYDESLTYTEDRYGHDYRIPVMGISFPSDQPDIQVMSVCGFFRPQDEVEGYEGFLSTSIDFDEFIEDLLVHRRFTWSLKNNDSLMLTPIVIERNCWKCHKPTLVCKEFYYFKQTLCEGGEKVRFDFIDRLEVTDVPERHLVLFNQHNRSQAINIGEIKMRHSRTVGGSYMSNGCVHCGVLQGAHFTSHSLQPAVCDMSHGVTVTVEGDEYKAGHWVQLD